MTATDKKFYTMAIDSKGQGPMNLISFLCGQGYGEHLKPGNIYDNAVRNAVALFQNDHQLKATGEMNERTCAVAKEKYHFDLQAFLNIDQIENRQYKTIIVHPNGAQEFA